MKKFKLTGEKLVNLGLLLVSIFYLSYSLCHYKLGTIRLPKEGFIPMLLGIGMVAISGFLTMQAFLGKGDAQRVKFKISWMRFGCIVAVSFLYALALAPLGYCIATFLFLLAVLKLAGVQGWIKPLMIALICSAAFYVLFRIALGVMLPKGIVGF